MEYLWERSICYHHRHYRNRHFQSDWCTFSYYGYCNNWECNTFARLSGLAISACSVGAHASPGCWGVQTARLQQIGSIAIAPPVVAVPAASPFSALVKLLDPKNFYGRLGERSTLIEKTRQKASTSIVGPRRIGKTWLLQYLMLVAPTELGADYHLVDMSAQSADFNTLIDFVEYVFQELKKQVQHGTVANTILEEALVALKKEQAEAEPNILSVLEKAMRDLSSEGDRASTMYR